MEFCTLKIFTCGDNNFKWHHTSATGMNFAFYKQAKTHLLLHPEIERSKQIFCISNMVGRGWMGGCSFMKTGVAFLNG